MKKILTIVLLVFGFGVMAEGQVYIPKSTSWNESSTDIESGLAEKSDLSNLQLNGKSQKEVRKALNDKRNAIYTEKKDGLQAIINGDSDRLKTEVVETFHEDLENYKNLRRVALQLRYEIRRSAPVSVIAFPVRNRYEAPLYYTGTTDISVDLLKEGDLQFSDVGGSIYQELISGYAGPLRLSFGALLGKTEVTQFDAGMLDTLSLSEIDRERERIDSVNQQATTVQSFLGGGGNGVVNLSMPVFDLNAEHLRGFVTAYARASMLLPELGTSAEDPQIINEFGAVVFGAYDFTDAQGEVSISGYLQGRFSRVGAFNNDTFYQDLGLSEEKSFWYKEIELGIIVVDQIKVSYSLPVGVKGTSLEDVFPSQITVGFLPFRKREG